MRIEPAAARESSHRVVVRVVLEGRDGIAERHVPSGEFESSERGLAMGTVLVPWPRVFHYELTVRQAVSAYADSDDGSRAMQRVTYRDEHDALRSFEVPQDRFESAPWAVTMLVERTLDPDTGELTMRRVTIPWHRIVDVERIFAVPEAAELPRAPS